MMTMAEQNYSYTVLPNKYSSGPHGLGDPDDKSLRKVEKNVLIAKKIREKSRTEKCPEEVKAFSQCAKDNSILVVFNCREVNRVMFSCLERWFKDEKFIEECTKEYLDERSEYRRTGIGVKYQKKKQTPSSTEKID